MDGRFGIAVACLLAVCAQAEDTPAAKPPEPLPPGVTPPVPTGKPHFCIRDYGGFAFSPAIVTTQLSITITTDGTVKDVVVTRSSGTAALDQSAVECASLWTYRPAQKDGHPVEVPWRVNVAWPDPQPSSPAKLENR